MHFSPAQLIKIGLVNHAGCFQIFGPRRAWGASLLFGNKMKGMSGVHAGSSFSLLASSTWAGSLFPIHKTEGLLYLKFNIAAGFFSLAHVYLYLDTPPLSCLRAQVGQGGAFSLPTRVLRSTLARSVRDKHPSPRSSTFTLSFAAFFRKRR